MVAASSSAAGLEPAPIVHMASPPKFPRFLRRDLSNGLRVATLRTGLVPLVNLVAAMPAGGQDDPPGLEGISALMLVLLKTGTSRRSDHKMAEDVASIGVDTASWADWDSGMVTMEVPTDDRELAAQLLIEMVFSPSFSEEALERARRQQLAMLRQAQWRADRKAEVWFHRTLYDGTEYGRPLWGTPESVERIGRQDLLHLHHERVAMAGVSFAAGGAVPEGWLMEVLAEVPADGRPEPQVAPRRMELAERSRMRLRIVDHPAAAQTVLWVGHQGLSRRDERFHLLRLLTQILSQRLAARLRESLGLAYQVRSVLAARLGCGPLVTQTALAHGEVSDAVRRILLEMERLGEEEVGEQELLAAKHGFIGEFLRSSQTGRQVAIKLKQLVASRLSDDHFDHQLQDVWQVDAGSLRQLARQCIRPRQAVIVAVGPRQELAEQFRGFSDPFTTEAR